MEQQWSVEESLATELVGVEEVTVRLVGGEVVITSTDGPARLEISGATRGPVEVSLKDGVLSVTHGESGGRGLFRRIATAGPTAKVLIAVPAHTRITIATVSADILIAGVAEPVDIRTVSGDLTMKDLSERVEARTVSGDVDAFGLAGDLSIATVSGDIGIVEGTCRWLRAKTVSGDFTLDLTVPHGSDYSIGTVSGDVSIRFPRDPSVRVEATSMSGRMNVNFDGAPATIAPGTRTFNGTFGSGDSRLTVKTLSGDLQISRKEAAA